MDEVHFESKSPDDVIAAGRSRRLRRRVVGGAALSLVAILAGTGVAMATGSTTSAPAASYSTPGPSFGHVSPTPGSLFGSSSSPTPGPSAG